ncbi:hypothetical protein Tco_0577825 [Tanacetum coccineum]
MRGWRDTRECLDTSCKVVGGSILRLVCIAVMKVVSRTTVEGLPEGWIIEIRTGKRKGANRKDPVVQLKMEPRLSNTDVILAKSWLSKNGTAADSNTYADIKPGSIIPHQLEIETVVDMPVFGTLVFRSTPSMYRGHVMRWLRKGCVGVQFGIVPAIFSVLLLIRWSSRNRENTTPTGGWIKVDAHHGVVSVFLAEHLETLDKRLELLHF